MEALGSVEKDSGASASTRTAEARQTRANSAPTALSDRLETMLLRSHPVPTPSNEVSVASEVSNGIILAAKAAVDARSFRRSGALR